MASYNSIPYIRAIKSSLYWPELNVGAVVGTLVGEYCQCGYNYCNAGVVVRPPAKGLLAVGLPTLVGAAIAFLTASSSGRDVRLP